jgi:hypothetical protein
MTNREPAATVLSVRLSVSPTPLTAKQRAQKPERQQLRPVVDEDNDDEVEAFFGHRGFLSLGVSFYCEPCHIFLIFHFSFTFSMLFQITRCLLIIL